MFYSVVKKLFIAIFTQLKFSNEDKFNLTLKLAKLSKRYKDFFIPHGKQSKPKFEEIDSWKAYQIRFMFLYLLVPLLHGILDAHCFKDLLYLHDAVYTLSKRSYYKIEAKQAHKYLVQFAINIKSWHALLCYIDFHDIAHLVDCVEIFSVDYARDGFETEVGAGLTAAGM